MDLEDVLRKPGWPKCDENIAQAIISILGEILAPLKHLKSPNDLPDVFQHLTLGFNSTMAAVEAHAERPLLAVLITRSSLGPELCDPFAICAAALEFKLVQLPPTPELDIAHGIVGIRASLENKSLHQLIANVPQIASNWAYAPAKFTKRQKNPTRYSS